MRRVSHHSLSLQRILPAVSPPRLLQQGRLGADPGACSILRGILGKGMVHLRLQLFQRGQSWRFGWGLTVRENPVSNAGIVSNILLLWTRCRFHGLWGRRPEQRLQTFMTQTRVA